MRHRKKIFIAVVFLVLCIACAGMIINFKKAPNPCFDIDEPAPKWVKKDLDGFTDDFNSVHPRWNFGDIERSGYHRLVKTAGISAAEIGIDPVDQYGDSDCSFEEIHLLRRAGVLSMRVKHSEKTEDFKAGTLGFGLWNNRDGYHYDAVWFVAFSKSSSPGLYGLSVVVLEKSAILFRKVISVDISQWHDYSIRITATDVIFSVDGQPVARAEGVHAAKSCKAIVAWVDNKAVNLYKNSHKIEFIPVAKRSFMLLDRISWQPDDYDDK